jgi:hypothetical protein
MEQKLTKAQLWKSIKYYNLDLEYDPNIKKDYLIDYIYTNTVSTSESCSSEQDVEILLDLKKYMIKKSNKKKMIISDVDITGCLLYKNFYFLPVNQKNINTFIMAKKLIFYKNKNEKNLNLLDFNKIEYIIKENEIFLKLNQLLYQCVDDNIGIWKNENDKIQLIKFHCTKIKKRITINNDTLVALTKKELKLLNLDKNKFYFLIRDFNNKLKSYQNACDITTNDNYENIQVFRNKQNLGSYKSDIKRYWCDNNKKIQILLKS